MSEFKIIFRISYYLRPETPCWPEAIPWKGFGRIAAHKEIRLRIAPTIGMRINDGHDAVEIRNLEYMVEDNYFECSLSGGEIWLGDLLRAQKNYDELVSSLKRGNWEFDVLECDMKVSDYHPAARIKENKS